MVPCVRLLRIRCVRLFEEIRGACRDGHLSPGRRRSRQRARQPTALISLISRFGGEKIKNNNKTLSKYLTVLLVAAYCRNSRTGEI